MKRITWPLMVAMLLSLCCACAKAAPVADIPAGDGYVPVAGLSFGMSLEDAKKIYPNLKDSYAEDSIIPGDRTLDELRAVYPSIDEQLLEDVEVCGQKATVKLRFMSLTGDAIADEERCPYGLVMVFVTFDESVDEDALIEYMEEMYDTNYDSSYGSLCGSGNNYGSSWFSKSQTSNLDAETLETLRDYMSNLTFTRKSDGEQIPNNFSMRIDRAMEGGGETYLRYLVTALFGPGPQKMKFTGWLAGYLYAARA